MSVSRRDQAVGLHLGGRAGTKQETNDKAKLSEKPRISSVGLGAGELGGDNRKFIAQSTGFRQGTIQAPVAA